MPKRSVAEVNEARVELAKILHSSPVRQGKRVIYGLVRHVSKSGMMREISLFVVDGDGEMRDVTYHASCLTGWSIGRHRGVRVAGVGMDMIFHLIDTIMHATERDGGSKPSEWTKHYRVESL